MNELIRLNKYLANQGIASRREADELISEGLVSVNGKIVREMGIKVDLETDEVTVNQKSVEERKELIYIMLNKPKGYVTAAKHTKQAPHIVLDLIDSPIRVYPVGRLDKDTTGLLILTNDGTLTFKLTHPSSQTEKEYEAQVAGIITGGAINKLKKGVKLFGEKTLPTKVVRVNPRTIRITLKEGKNRQIRRICQKVGFPIKKLKRIRIKNLSLCKLPEGAWRKLTTKEVIDLKK